MHGRFVQQQQRRKTARLGDQRGVAQDDADQQRLLLAGGGERGRYAGRRIGEHHVGAVGAHSEPTRPRHRAPRAGEAARSQSSTASAGVASSRSAIAQARVMRAAGKPGDGGTAFIRATSAIRAAVAATAWRAMASSRPASQDGSARAFRQQSVALRHGGVVRGDLARVARLQRPDQPIEEAPAAGRAFLEQPVHLRRQPDRGDAGGDLGLAARRRHRRGGTRADVRRPSRCIGCRCRCPPRRPRWRSARRPPSRRRRLAAADRRCARRAGRGREPAATPPPAGWSCRCRSARTAR